MAKFQILIDDVLLGASDLEFGDPPMAVAFGRLIPTVTIDTYRDQIFRASCHGTPGVEVVIKAPSGHILECAGGAYVQGMQGDDGGHAEFEVSALGVVSPPYEDLFPQHVSAYKSRER